MMKVQGQIKGEHLALTGQQQVIGGLCDQHVGDDRPGSRRIAGSI